MGFIAKSVDAAEALTGLDLPRENGITEQGRDLAYRPKFAQADQSTDPAPLSGTTAFGQSDNGLAGTDSNSPTYGNGQKVNPVSGSEAVTVKEEERYDRAERREGYLREEDRRIATWQNSPASARSVAQMDQDIARLQQYAPNSPELAILIQLRGLRADQLARTPNT